MVLLQAVGATTAPHDTARVREEVEETQPGKCVQKRTVPVTVEVHVTEPEPVAKAVVPALLAIVISSVETELENV
jgi:hypothetical protein